MFLSQVPPGLFEIFGRKITINYHLTGSLRGLKMTDKIHLTEGSDGGFVTQKDRGDPRLCGFFMTFY